MSAAEHASEASNAEQANERTDERVAQYLHLGFWMIYPTVYILEKILEKTLKLHILRILVGMPECRVHVGGGEIS